MGQFLTFLRIELERKKGEGEEKRAFGAQVETLKNFFRLRHIADYRNGVEELILTLGAATPPARQSSTRNTNENGRLPFPGEAAVVRHLVHSQKLSFLRHFPARASKMFRFQLKKKRTPAVLEKLVGWQLRGRTKSTI